MDQSNRSLQSTDDKRLLLDKLRQDQKLTKEGSNDWDTLQKLIDHIVAQNLLEYVNR